jgi:quercetin 2,3-dioxygenase
MRVSLQRASKRDLFEKTAGIQQYNYHRCENSRFGALCDLNETIIEPLGSFNIEPHQDREIIIVITQGSLVHTDILGNNKVMHAGQIQYIGSGDHLKRFEFNTSATETTKLLQFWIIPQMRGTPPRYEQRNCDMDRFNRWAQIISGNGKKNSLRIMQDVTIRVSHLFLGHTLVSDPLKSGYGRLLLVVDGEVNACGHILKRLDELQVIGDEPFEITANKDARLFLLDIPMSDFEKSPNP